MKSIFRNKSNYKPKKEYYESPTGDSLTIPDDALHIRDIVQKHSNGIIMSMAKDHYYHDTDDFDYEDPATKMDFDLTDLDEARTNVKELTQKIDQINKRKSEIEKQEKTTPSKSEDVDKRVDNPIS